VPELTGIELATIFAAVAGAAVAFAGTMLVSRQQRKTQQAIERARAITDAIAAADDLKAAVDLYRAAGGSVFFLAGPAAGIRQSLTGVASMLPIDWAATTRQQKLLLSAVDFLLALAPGGAGHEALHSASSKFMAMVTPSRQRLSTACSVLRVDADARLAHAAADLAATAGEFADSASSTPRVFKKAERLFTKNLAAFQQAARPQRRRFRRRGQRPVF
jgi:hypothetical protein